MSDISNFSTLLQQDNAWLFVPGAIALGALHGLEPGHSKTMMAAFIIAIRGTLTQAVLLGLAATFSHTLVVWAIALAGLYFGQQLDAEASTPYFQIASAALIIVLALWMLWRARRDAQRAHQHEHHHHEHDHGDHQHHHASQMGAGLEVAGAGYQDAHELAHAHDIRRRFANRQASTAQIVLFGLTGGLLPCPASITVLLICLQLKKIALGAALVLSFSVGLALTLVASGVVAALSIRYASRVAGRWHGLGDIARKAPYLSGMVMLGLGLYVGYAGVHALLMR